MHGQQRCVDENCPAGVARMVVTFDEALAKIRAETDDTVDINRKGSTVRKTARGAAFEKLMLRIHTERGELRSRDPSTYSLNSSFRAMGDAIRDSGEPSAAEVRAVHIARSLLSNPDSHAARRLTDAWQGRIDDLKSYGVLPHRYERWERLLAGEG